MVNHVYTILRDSCEWARNMPSEKQRRPLQLVSAGGPLKFVKMAILRPFPKTLGSSQSVLVRMIRYMKLKRAIHISMMTASHTAPFSWTNGHSCMESPNIFWKTTEHRLSGSFRVFLRLFGTNQLATTAYNSQTNKQPERFNKTIIARLWHKVDDHQRNQDIYM